MEVLNHVMIDLETLGVKPNAAFVSIGAVCFNPKINQIQAPGHAFYRRIDWSSATMGRTMDPDTIRWWFKQSEEARNEIVKSGDTLHDVLTALRLWLPKNCVVWGNGSTFDISILEDAYRQHFNVAPWQFWNVRDCRTVVDIAEGFVDKSIIKFDGVAHNALDDAVHQAKYICQMYESLRSRVE